MKFNNEIAIFYLEKVVNTYVKNGIAIGERAYKILGWDSIKELDDLPKEYTSDESCPCFWIIDREIYIRVKRPKSYLNAEEGVEFFYFKEGKLISKDVWEKVIEPVLKAAGKRLGKIMREKRETDQIESSCTHSISNIPLTPESEIDRLANFILKELPEEIGKGDFVHGESAVDVAIRLLKDKKTWKGIKDACDAGYIFFLNFKQSEWKGKIEVKI